MQYLQVMGPDSLQFMRKLIDKLQLQQINILRFIACTEIFIMPAIIFMMFAWVYILLSDLWVLSLALICFMLYNLAFHFRGKCSFFLPFVYYKFLSLRYTSRRNPYCRFVKIYFNACVPACLICYNTLKIYALH